MIDITDKLRYYFGCEVLVPESNKRGKFTGFDWDDDQSIIMFTVRYSDDLDDFDVLNDWLPIRRIKPILRRLESITEEEKKELAKIVAGNEILRDFEFNLYYLGGIRIIAYVPGRIIEAENYSPLMFHYLISRGFWLFEPEAFDNGSIVEKL